MLVALQALEVAAMYHQYRLGAGRGLVKNWILSDKVTFHPNQTSGILLSFPTGKPFKTMGRSITLKIYRSLLSQPWKGQHKFSTQQGAHAFINHKKKVQGVQELSKPTISALALKTYIRREV
jgi:hypothetical protein